MPSFIRFITAAACLLAQPLIAAMEEGTSAFDSTEFKQRAELAERALFKEGKLHTLASLLATLKTGPKPEPITLPPLATAKLEPQDVYRKLLPSVVVAGLYYHCRDCGGMHFSSGGGFAMADGGIFTTSAHVFAVDEQKMIEAYPMIVDEHGRGYAVDKIIAYDPVGDTVVFHVVGADLPPLPLRSEVRVGEPVYCLSHPNENMYVFTAGMVNRVEARTEQGNTLRCVDVSCDYSPGSSGCPITDSAGNVVAQVEKIFPQLMAMDHDPANSDKATVYNLRSAIGANQIAQLADPAHRPALDDAAIKSIAGTGTPAAHPTATPAEASAAQVFVFHTKFDLIAAPENELLDQKVKSFADLYAQADAHKDDYMAWGSLEELQDRVGRSDDPIGFTGVTGYYRDPKSEGPPTQDNTTSRGIDFKFLAHDRTKSEVGITVEVNDNRDTPKAADNKFQVEAKIPKDAFTLVKLGSPQKGKQAWLAITMSQFDGTEVPPAAQMGVLAPGEKVNFKFTASDGKEVDTEKMRGKVILVDFWATWCGPCLEAAPRIEELYHKFHDQGLEVIGINMDNERTTMDVYLAKHPSPWPQSISAPNGGNPLADRFKIQGIPFFLLIDKEGIPKIIEAREPSAEDLIKERLEAKG